MSDHLIRQTTFMQIVSRFFPHLGRHQNRLIKLTSFLMNLIKFLVWIDRRWLGRSCLVLKRNASLVCYDLDRIHKGDSTVVLNKLKDISRATTSETMVKLLVFNNIKGWSLFAMKRTEAQKVTARLGQRNNFSNDFNNVYTVFNFCNQLFINHKQCLHFTIDYHFIFYTKS